MQFRQQLLMVLCALPFFVGCFRQSDTFAQRSSELACKRRNWCTPDAFQAQWGVNESSCVDDLANAMIEFAMDIEDAQRSCDPTEATCTSYSPRHARECVELLFRYTYDCSDEATQEIGTVCYQVFYCGKDCFVVINLP